MNVTIDNKFNNGFWCRCALQRNVFLIILKKCGEVMNESC